MAKSAAEIDVTSCDQVAALPWRVDADGKVRILLVTSRTNGKWMLPKGWPIAGKSAAEAAGIEAKEEAGVDGLASESAIGSCHFIKLFDDGTSKPAQAVVYPLRVTDELLKWDERANGSGVGFAQKKQRTPCLSPTSADFCVTSARTL